MPNTANSPDTLKVAFAAGCFSLGSMEGRQSLHSGEVVFHRLLHLLEGAHLDLSHALARDAELSGELHKCKWFLSEPACLEDAPLAVIEDRERSG